MKTLNLLDELVNAVNDDLYNVEEGNADASALYFALHQIAKVAGASMKESALIEPLKNEIELAGKGYEFGANNYGFTIAHSVRTTYTPVIPNELLEWEKVIKEAKKASQDCTKKGKPGAIVMTNDGEPFEVMPAEIKSASDVFTLKVLS